MTARRKRRIPVYVIIIIILVISTAAVLLKTALDYLEERYLLTTHPLEYTGYVEKYALEYGLDKYLVYAVIKTESSFKADALSDAGAVGLMQIMEDTFDWINFRLDEEADYSVMNEPETNIRYGCYLLYYLSGLYEDRDCAVAAYHAGAGSVSGWLLDPRYSSDGKTLKEIPISDTAHYVDKINKAYQNYIKLYNEKFARKFAHSEVSG